MGGRRLRRASVSVQVTQTWWRASHSLRAKETGRGRSTSDATLEAPLRAVFAVRGAEIRAEASHPTLSSRDNNNK